MSQFARVSDLVETGGVILDGASTVFSGGQPLALIGSLVSPHDCCNQSGNSHTVGTPCGEHCQAILIGDLTETVTCEGRQIARVGTLATCAHRVITGINTVGSNG